ncbi:MAG: DNRLRE domain-containing protein [Planctomycetes bacterium]|nr:DNRLRE domain-containing protein [Planctomycetota bacterium]
MYSPINIRKTGRNLAIGLVGAAAMPLGVMGSGFVFIPPEADSCVVQTMPDTNYGSDPNLLAGDVVGSYCYSYLRFDLSGIPEYATVTSAEIYLFFGSCGPPGETSTVYAYETQGAWAESTVTWTNRPTHAQLLGDMQDSCGTPSAGYLYLDEPAANGFLSTLRDAGQPLSVALWTGDGPGHYSGIYSKEWGTPGERPQLHVHYAAANDEPSTAKAIGNVTALPFDTSIATSGGGGCTTGPNVWYCYTATCQGTARVSLCGSSYDTMLAAYEECGAPLGVILGCSDDDCGAQSELAFPVEAGDQIMIEVGGDGGASGPGALTIECTPCPKDVDRDGDVDFGDILGVIGSWGPCPTGSHPGLWLEEYVGEGWVPNGYQGLTTYRLSVNLDAQVLSVFGLAGTPLTASSSDGFFHNDPFGDLTAPLDLTGVGIWSNQWDTYVTIGATSSAGDATGLSSGFQQECNNLEWSFSSDSAGWFVTPDDAQSQPDTDGRVLVAQFVVAEGASIDGVVNVLLGDDTMLTGLYFNSVAPPCPADVNGDHTVDFGDILALIGAWGPCP